MPLWQERGTPGAPGMLIAHLKCTVASTGGTLTEVPTRATKLSQWCHGCGRVRPQATRALLASVPVRHRAGQRDLYSAFLAAHLDPADPIPSCARYQQYWKVPGWAGRRACRQHTSESSNARNRGGAAPKHGHPSCRSAFAQKSERSHTRATVPLQERESGSVEAPPRSPRAEPGESSGKTLVYVMHMKSCILCD